MADRYADYIPAAERLKEFWERFPEGRVITSISEHDRDAGFILIHAALYRNTQETEPAATGHAQEVRGEGHVNRGFYVENAETSAIARALQNLGFESRRADAESNARPPAATHKNGSPAPVQPEPRTLATRQQAVGRVKALRQKLQVEHGVESSSLNVMLGTFGCTTPDELDEVQAKAHIAELSAMYNDLVKQKAARATERRDH